MVFYTVVVHSKIQWKLIFFYVWLNLNSNVFKQANYHIIYEYNFCTWTWKINAKNS